MSELTEKNFGIVIAFILPGFVALWGMKYFSPTIEAWITTSQQNSQSVANFCYVTLASLAVGLTISAVRWAVIDTIHHATGVIRCSWKFSKLDDKLQGFLALVENHYRYYQFYANMFIAFGFLFSASHLRGANPLWANPGVNIGFMILETIFFLGSRDSLQKYYSRVGELLGTH